MIRSFEFHKYLYPTIFTAALFLIFGAIPLAAQRNDHLTEKESDLIREAQELDRRMEVFLKAIERRFFVLEGKKEISPESKKEAKKLAREKEKWGELPEASKSKLLTDIEKILDEAINNIDDAAGRESKSELFPKGVHILADGVRGFVPKLKTFYENAQSERERAVTYQALEYCQLIIDASAKVKKPVAEKKKKKS
jgi:hypothetical protein